MSLNVWSNVAVAIESARATALTVSAVTKANPGVVSYTGTDPSNGNYVLMTANGMTQINKRIFRVTAENSGTDVFSLEGENTTSYGTFTSGTASVITFGTSLGTITTLTGSGGEPDKIDQTTIHDSVKKIAYGLSSALEFTGTSMWDVSDTGLLALKTASDAQSEIGVLFTFATGYKFCFLANVNCALLPTGAAGQSVTTPVAFTLKGGITTYTT